MQTTYADSNNASGFASITPTSGKLPAAMCYNGKRKHHVQIQLRVWVQSSKVVFRKRNGINKVEAIYVQFGLPAEIVRSSSHLH